MKLILGLALIGIIVLAVTMLLRRSDPRITTIEHRRDDEEGK
ncbi:hypothetical protein [Sphingomonas sp. LY160]|nr:hypothetical protein [Sphingomonas sp. LY160]MEA1071398.1 hypothetical protein [Sphingomonas sp. LY160]